MPSVSACWETHLEVTGVISDWRLLCACLLLLVMTVLLTGRRRGWKPAMISSGISTTEYGV